VRAREASGEEAELLWRRFFEQQGLLRHFRRLAGRDVPMFVLQPVTSETRLAQTVAGLEERSG
jgi:hypothetical protein